MKSLIIGALVVTTLAGCATHQQSNQALGAILGGAVGHHAIGGAAGTAIGAMVGSHIGSEAGRQQDMANAGVITPPAPPAPVVQQPVVVVQPYDVWLTQPNGGWVSPWYAAPGPYWHWRFHRHYGWGYYHSHRHYWHSAPRHGRRW